MKKINYFAIILLVSFLISCGDKEKDEKQSEIPDNVSIILPDNQSSKLLIELEIDSVETNTNPSLNLVTFPTPFKNETKIKFEIQVSDFYKIVVKELSTNKTETIFDDQLVEGNHAFSLDTSLIENFNEGFLEIQFYRDLDIIENNKILYLKNRNMLINEENITIRIDEYDVTNKDIIELSTSFNYLFGETIKRITASGQILQSYRLTKNMKLILIDENGNILTTDEVNFDNIIKNSEYVIDK